MKLNCLIVDDDPVFRVMIKELVTRDHQRLNLVGVAESAEEAEELYEQQEVDLFFLDLGLPGMSGFELIEKIGNPDDLQIILVTGHKEYALDAFEYDVVDYLVKPISWERFDEAVSRALRKKTRPPQEEIPENIIFKKVAQYMYSRDLTTLNPVPLRFAKVGYAYPMATANFDFEREHKALDILEEAEKDGLLKSDFIDSFYVCNTCYNSHLHFRESCPHCKSTNLKSEDLVHHFSCAYMGPLSDFYEKSEDENLVCPKCEKTLNHIGVDYDKPSTIYRCIENGHSFQNPLVKAKCHSCGADTLVEHLIKKDIRKYALTQTGEQVAEGKFEVSLNGFGPLDDIMDESFFLRVLGKSVKRKKEAGEEACLAEMHFDNIAELHEKIGEERTNNLVRELYQIIIKEISVTDELVFQNKETAWLLLTEKNTDEAKDTLMDLASLIHELIHDNFDGFDLEISMELQPVDTGKPAKEQLNVLRSKALVQK